MKKYTDVDFEMFIMPFGKYKNSTIEELSASYILWLLDQDFCPDVLKAYGDLYEEELKERSFEEKADEDIMY